MKPTRTSETEKQYLDRATCLAKEFRQAYGFDWTDDPLAFCRFIGDKRKSWRPSTWWFTRSSLVYFLESYGETIAADTIREFDAEPCTGSSRNGPAQKAKRLPSKEMSIILEELNNRRGEYHALLALWLVAGRLVGLRPNEWAESYLENNVLVVKNAKATNDRSFGETRHIVLDSLDEQEQMVIQRFLNELHAKIQQKGGIEKIYRAARGLLHRVCRKLWPDRKTYPTLYSARHQFSANLKKAGLSTLEIAALFGHGSDRTATEHYGRKIVGEEGGGVVRAKQEDIQKVRNKARQRPAPLSPVRTSKENG